MPFNLLCVWILLGRLHIWCRAGIWEWCHSIFVSCSFPTTTAPNLLHPHEQYSFHSNIVLFIWHLAWMQLSCQPEIFLGRETFVPTDSHFHTQWHQYKTTGILHITLCNMNIPKGELNQSSIVHLVHTPFVKICLNVTKSQVPPFCDCSLYHHQWCYKRGQLVCQREQMHHKPTRFCLSVVWSQPTRPCPIESKFRANGLNCQRMHARLNYRFRPACNFSSTFVGSPEKLL